MYPSFRHTLALALFVSVLAAPVAAQTWQCTTGPLTDGVKPSREGFFREVLFAPGSARTSTFDDYTPDSYHVDKLDLAQGLTAVAEKCGVVLEGLMVVGPEGPLWAYHVITLLSEGDSLRLTHVVMPHARITAKATGLISRDQFDELLTLLRHSSLVHSGQPSWPDTTTDRVARDFSYDLLAVRYATQGAQYWNASIMETDAASPLRDAVTALLKGLVPTYLHGN